MNFPVTPSREVIEIEKMPQGLKRLLWQRDGLIERDAEYMAKTLTEAASHLKEMAEALGESFNVFAKLQKYDPELYKAMIITQSALRRFKEWE